MIRQELVKYLKQAKESGHSMETAKSVLVQQGWSEQDVNEALLAMMAPSMSTPTPPQPTVGAPITPGLSIEKKIPDHYVSPLSVLLAVVLFFSLFTLTGQIMNDIERVIAPYSGNSIQTTPEYLNAYEIYGQQIPVSKLNTMQLMWETRHTNDQVSHLFVAGIISALFWAIAFGIHYLVGGLKRQYLPLSIPFFLTAGIYLVSTLFEVISQLFQKEAEYAVYITLIVFIVIVTISFMFYQKRSHAEKSL